MHQLLGNDKPSSANLYVAGSLNLLRMQGEEGRLYEDLGTYDLMKPVVEELLAEYNSKKKPMNLVFFDDAIEHLTRIHRILRLQQVPVTHAFL